MTEQQRSTERRRYRKTKRAEDEERTRARIVDAAEALHGSIGPAQTTISAIAERAGVTRATVYRHFPDEVSLFVACSGQWMSRQPVVDPSAWTRHDQPLTRLRAALGDIYRFYRSGEDMLRLAHRDAEAVPPAVAEIGIEVEQQWLAVLTEAFAPRPRKMVRAAVAHAIAFSTWQSLCVTQGLTDRQAIELVTGMVGSASGVGEGRRSRAKVTSNR